MDHFSIKIKFNFMSNFIHFLIIIIQKIVIFRFNGILYLNYYLERLINY